MVRQSRSCVIRYTKYGDRVGVWVEGEQVADDESVEEAFEITDVSEKEV